MADEETKQLLRDILAAQTAQLEYLQQQHQTYTAHSQDYEKTSALYKRLLEDRLYDRAIRLATAVSILALVIYVIFRG